MNPLKQTFRFSGCSKVDTKRYLQFFFNVFHYVSASPFKFVLNKDHQLVLKVPRNPLLYTYVCLATLTIFYMAHVIHELHEKLTFYIEGRQYIHVTFHFGWIFCWSMMLCQHASNALVGYEMHDLLKGLTQFAASLEHRFLHTHPNLFRRSTFVREWIMMTCFANFLCTTAMVSGPMFFLFRDQSWHFGSIPYKFLLLQGFPSFFAFIVGVVIEAWYIAWSWGVFLIHFFVNLVYFQTFFTVPPFLNISLQDNIPDILMIYNQLRILARVYNNSYGKYYIAPILTLHAMGTILGIFVAIKFQTVKDSSEFIILIGATLAIILTFDLFVLASFAGKVHDESSNLQDNLSRRYFAMRQTQSAKISRTSARTRRGQVSVKQLIKTFKVEAVQCAIFFPIQKSTSLSVLLEMSDMAVSALLSVDF